MDKKRRFLIGFIALNLIFAIGDYFYSKRDSYNKYKSGEYFFRARATTVPTSQDDWWTPEAQARDYSDSKNVLMSSSNATVYAYDPDGAFCTVLYGDKVIENFPISRLTIEKEDLRDFYGTEKYSYKEYIRILDNLSKKEFNNGRVSSKSMRNYKSIGNNMWLLVAFDAALAVLLILFAWKEIDEAITWTLYAGVAYSIFFNIGTLIFIR